MMKLSKKDEKELMNVYDTWWNSYLNGDVKTYDSFFTDDYHFVGSTNGEEYLNRKDTTAFFQATADQLAGKAELRNLDRWVEEIEGGIIIITDLADAYVISKPEWIFYSRFRFTSMLRKTKEGWRFFYQHFSAPDSKAQEGETLGTEKITKENEELRDAIKRRTVELEHKNKELAIEASLERIRAKVTAMQESSDLLDIVVTMRSEFVGLGHEAHYFWHMRWLPDKYEKAMTSGDGSRIGMVMELPRHIHGNIKVLADWEKSEAPAVVYGMDVETAVDYVDKMITLGDFKQVDHNAPTLDDIRHIGGLTFVMARSTHGEIGYSLPGVVSNPPAQAVATLVRFAGVFDLAYRRFEDLNQAEKQYREAQIELALERVRSRTMGMHKSEELKDVIQVVYEQFILLNIHVEHAGFIIDYKERDDMHIWLADQHEVPFQVIIPYFDCAHWNSYIEAKEKSRDFFANNLDFEEKNRFYEDLFKLVPVPDETKEYYFSCPGLAISTVLLENIGLYIENFSGIPYLDEENNILMRFGKVFQQTYTRFLDLQKAEELAKQAAEDLVILKIEKKKTEEALTELKNTQAQLIQSEKMASLGELTAGIAHEIQNPLNFVNNFSDVSAELLDEMKEQLATGNIQQANEIADDVRLNLEKIVHHGKRADAIVKGMLQHSRSDTGQKELTDLNALADEYVRLAFHGWRAKDKAFNATFTTDFDKSVGNLRIISQEIARVVLNLLNNAFYAVNEKGKKQIKGYQPQVTVTTKKTNDRVELYVIDNGNGIPKEVLEKIFQPFFTTKPTGQGTGLGLSLSYDIITKGHGGKLKVETKEGEGTTFLISLPV